MTQFKTAEINELLFRLLDNNISDNDYARLKQWFDADPNAKKYYCRFMVDNSAMALSTNTTIQQADTPDPNGETLSEDFWQLMAEQEKNAPAMQIPKAEAEPARELIYDVRREPVVRSINKTAVVVAAASLLALLAMILFVQFAPPAPYEVATITDSVDARWSSSLPIQPGTRLSSRTKPIILTDGVVTLTTDEDVKVVLEAPAQFSFVSYSEIALDRGKLFAHVSEQGCGFSVATPNSKIVDLGTEFGVICDASGNTEVHMFEGKANLFAGQKSENKISEFLLGGSAKKVSSHDSRAKDIVLEDDVVVRSVDSGSGFVWRGQSVNLADIVGGGNGFNTGQINRGIEPTTGRFTRRLTTSEVYEGSTEYIRVPASPYIDGVFTPGTQEGFAKVSSTNIQSEAFPFKKAQMWAWGYICNGAWHEGFDVPRHNLELGGVELEGRKNPAIMMHSNLGITFDLAAIRDELPGLRIKSFSSVFGVSETANKWLKSRDFSTVDRTPGVAVLSEDRSSTAEFWVLLDGKNVFHDKTSSGGKPGKVELPIDDNTRFLTIAVTEADDSHMFDWAAFAWPELKLELQ
ncbi:FecR protein [Anaerohalosphaera lusitana]|uniref:FecR protein n=1 Tax=Anaerohalosphaera lusitana TaxID=1936003 RepID=A0A1U9NN40_9BACT|nr:FecR family protein [Anaerohalosphaera lusitana]AQT69217.1 FecR protein [Anaerohalosphaera lusitana]